MNAKITFAAVVLVVLQFAGFSAGYAYYESAINLENKCNETVTISCPTQQSGKAGTVRFWKLPASHCKVNVTLEASCGYAYNTYAIYFNIRKFILPYTDGIRIYEDESQIKALDGSLSASYDPASVAQVRTRYTRQPAVRIDYVRGPSLVTAANEAFFDYIIVEGQSTYRTIYCSALSGYVSDNYICDQDGSTDRCNCPSDYSPRSYGRNPAYSRQSCRSSSGDSSSSGSSSGESEHNESEYRAGYSSYKPSAGASTGITISVISVLVALARVIAYANKRSSRPSPLESVMTSSSESVKVSGPVVVGLPVCPVSTAPPSYDQVMGPGGATTYPAALVQKF